MLQKSQTLENSASQDGAPDASSLSNIAHIHKIWFEWPEAQYEHLKECWAAGMSAALAADSINRKFKTAFTRNAVIGKVNRHGLSVALGRAKTPSGKTKSPYPKREAKVRLAVENIPTIDDAAIPFNQRKTLMTLECGDCKWLVGDPSTRDFFYCGGKAKEGKPFCAGHCKRAFGYTSEPRTKKSWSNHLWLGAA